MEERKQNDKGSHMFVTRNKCGLWWGSVRAHTESVQKCLVMDQKPDKNNVV